jgi:hypothetical protein
MGITNVQGGLEDRIATYMGELEEVETEIKKIEEGIDALIKLKNRAKKLRHLIIGATDIIMDANPEWQKKIKPRRKRKWHSPFKPGEIGTRALAVLFEHDRWMRPRDVAFLMLDVRENRQDERETIDKLTNSIGGYFAKHKGDLVESRGDFAKEWRLIRRPDESGENLT